MDGWVVVAGGVFDEVGDGNSAQVEVVEVEATEPEAEDEEEEKAEGEGEVGREGGVVEGGDCVLRGKGGKFGENVEVEHAGGDGLYVRGWRVGSMEESFGHIMSCA